MPGAGTNSFLGGIFGGIGQGLIARAQKKQQEKDQKLKNQVSLLTLAAQTTEQNGGDPSPILNQLDELIGNVKPGTPQARARDLVHNIVSSSAQRAGQGNAEQAGGQPQRPQGPAPASVPGLPSQPTSVASSASPFTGPLLSGLPPIPTSADAAKAADARTLSMERAKSDIEQGRESALESQRSADAIALAKAKPGTERVDTKPVNWEQIPEDERPEDGKKGEQYVRVRNTQTGEVVRYDPIAPTASKPPASLAALMPAIKAKHPDWDDDQVTAEASKQYTDQKVQVTLDRAQRLNQYLKLSNQELEKNADALAYMKANQPLTLAAKQLGILRNVDAAKSARALATAMSKDPNSPVYTEDIDDITQRLRDEGFTGLAGGQTPSASDALKAQASALRDKIAAASKTTGYDPAKDPDRAKLQALLDQLDKIR